MDMMELFYYIYMDEQEKKKSSSSDQEEEDEKEKAGNYTDPQKLDLKSNLREVSFLCLKNMILNSN